MSLILAVDPDSRHAAQLQSMARTHLHSEIVMADSADRAVAALADRVPDIVLTAPLLPGRDEAVLSEHLRALGTAAAHVQTLTIPILSAAAAAPERTLLGRFRRNRVPVDNDDGCDPAVFAEQIGQYLRRARQSRGKGESHPMPTPILVEAETPILVEEDVAEFLEGQVVPVITIVDEPETDDVVVMDDAGQDVDLSALLEELSSPSLPPMAPPRARTKSFEPLPRPAWFDADVVESPAPLRPVMVPAVMPLPASAREAREAPPANVQQHLITLPAGNGAQVQASVNVSVAVAVNVSAATTTATVAPKRRPRAPKPVQDEWGFFDPDQCGFRALVARLDAIAEVEEAD